MRKDIKLIKDGAEIVVPADKTRNLYRVPVPQYEKLMRENITKRYKLAPDNTYAGINAEAKAIAVDLQQEDRMECLAKVQACVTLKDQKDGFAESLPCRLINPGKSEVGVVSKYILDGIIGPRYNDVCKNLWKKTSGAINWFKAIENKSRFTFIVFDIEDLSITEDLQLQALDYAKSYALISKKATDIILHYRKSLLFNKGQAWVKKEDVSFYFTMGSYDGAEACELVGAFMQRC